MKKRTKKLHLHRETLSTLHEGTLRRAMGGAEEESDGGTCMTCGGTFHCTFDMPSCITSPCESGFC